MVLAFILILTGDGEAGRREPPSVLLGSKGSCFQSRHHIIPRSCFRWRCEHQPAARRQYPANPSDQAPLIVWRKQKHQSPGQDSIKRSIEKSRILDGFTRNGRVWEIAAESFDERRRRIDAIDFKSFRHQNRGNGNAGPTAKVNNGSPARQRPGPVAHPRYPDRRRSSAYKLGSDAFISVRSIQHVNTIAKRVHAVRPNPAVSGQPGVKASQWPRRFFTYVKQPAPDRRSSTCRRYCSAMVGL
jgi:hypothetical protein